MASQLIPATAPLPADLVAAGRTGGRVYVISPTGELRGRIPIPEVLATNLTFGPPDLKTLFITAGRNLYRMRITVSGYVLYTG